MIIEKSKCTGCRACESNCPKNSITMVRDEYGFLYPKIDLDTCCECDLCRQICPILSEPVLENPKEPIAYAIINKDEEIRMRSSSGGIFYLLSKWVIDNNGVVFGAKFNDKFEVVHDYTETLENLEPFMGSKYVQSDINNCYIKAKYFLDTGRIVLFTGTPCQIGGLKAYLRKDYENLICQDLICHGVPSPLVWQKYIEYREKEAKSKAKGVFFRYKQHSWKSYAVQFEFFNGTEYIQVFNEDLYMKSFIQNICLRESCYSCNFKTVNRQADITLADFWGVNKECHEMDDDKGTSLVIIHSEKGQRIFDAISSENKYKQVNFKKAVSHNSAYFQSAYKNANRDKFFAVLKSKPFDKAFKKSTKTSLIKRIINKLRRCLKRN